MIPITHIGYLQRSERCLAAATKLWEKSDLEMLVPICLLLTNAVEFSIKCLLVTSGKNPTTSHNLTKLINLVPSGNPLKLRASTLTQEVAQIFPNGSVTSRYMTFGLEIEDLSKYLKWAIALNNELRVSAHQQ